MMRRIIFSTFLLVSVSLSAQNQIKFGEMELPVRMTRTIGITGSWGWNGLVGFGPTLQYYISPHFGLDAGLGIALSGFKFSGRLRYLFLEKNFSPIIGAGYIYSTGFQGQYLEIEDFDTGQTFIVEILPSSFIPIVGGVEVLFNKGFFLMGNIGYAIQVNDNINIISGNPSSTSMRSLEILYGSGIIFEINIGYIFGNKGRYRGKL